MLKNLLNFVRSDIKVKGTRCFGYDEQIVDGFYFVYKKPFSTIYNQHAPIEIEHLDYVLKKLHKALQERKREVSIMIDEGTLSQEEIVIPHGEVLRACNEIQKLKIRVLENKLKDIENNMLKSRKNKNENVIYFREYTK